MKHPIMLLAAATAVISCSSPELPMGRGRNIRPNVSTMALTRGTTTTIDNLTAFKMIAVTDMSKKTWCSGLKDMYQTSAQQIAVWKPRVR